jgi:hypothetical protein
LTIEPGLVLSQPANKLFGRKRPGKEVALCGVASILSEKPQLLFGLYALGDDRHTLFLRPSVLSLQFLVLPGVEGV